MIRRSFSILSSFSSGEVSNKMISTFTFCFNNVEKILPNERQAFRLDIIIWFHSIWAFTLSHYSKSTFLFSLSYIIFFSFEFKSGNVLLQISSLGQCKHSFPSLPYDLAGGILFHPPGQTFNEEILIQYN